MRMEDWLELAQRLPRIWQAEIGKNGWLEPNSLCRLDIEQVMRPLETPRLSFDVDNPGKGQDKDDKSAERVVGPLKLEQTLRHHIDQAVDEVAVAAANLAAEEEKIEGLLIHEEEHLMASHEEDEEIVSDEEAADPETAAAAGYLLALLGDLARAAQS